MGYAIPSDYMNKRAEASMIAEAWSIIKHHLGDLRLSEQWVKQYHDRSVTYRNPKSGKSVKITIDGQVFHDQRKANNEYKSEHFSFSGDIGFAAVKAKELLVSK